MRQTRQQTLRLANTNSCNAYSHPCGVARQLQWGLSLWAGHSSSCREGCDSSVDVAVADIGVYAVVVVVVVVVWLAVMYCSLPARDLTEKVWSVGDGNLSLFLKEDKK